VFEQSAMPTAILKDGGSDLKKAVELINDRSQGPKIQVIGDVGHAAANALEHEFGKQERFKQFVSLITQAAAKLRQSPLAFLTPPKLRSKGRFQSITRLSDWAKRILPLMGKTRNSDPETLSARLRKYIPSLHQYDEFLGTFSFTCDVACQFLQLMKNDGFSDLTAKQAEELLAKLPEDSRFRKRMSLWLQTQRVCHKTLGLGQMPMPVSSDIIESLFGKLKAAIAKNPKAEFNKIILTIPTLCGTISPQIIDKALQEVSHRDLEAWLQKHVSPSQRQARRAFHQGKLAPDMVPKTGEKFWKQAV